MRRIFLTISIGILLIALLPLGAGGAGLGVAPPVMEIADAEKGQHYEELVYVHYNNESDVVIELSVSGDIESWTTFYELDDQTTPVESIIAPNGEWTYAWARFDIPVDAPAGEVTGTLHVRTEALAGVEGGAAVSLVGQVNVIIHIAGGLDGDGEITTPIDTSTPTATASADNVSGTNSWRNAVIGLSIVILILVAIFVAFMMRKSRVRPEKG